MVSNNIKDMDNDYFMHLYTKNDQWNKNDVYAYIFGKVTYHTIQKYRSQITN